MSSLIQALHGTFISLYVATLAVLTVYGMHRYVQVYLYWRNCRKEVKPAGRFDQLPRVTIQLPMFNEQFVAERVIEHACQMDYPRHLLQIQVLDDSTDESADIASACCERMREAGHNIEYIHRTNRDGYKAGALENGLKTATGEFVVIFDADFVPQRDMLSRSIHYFTDPNVGCVQTRWDHINRDQSILTRCQAVFLDGHFMIEHTARNRSGRFINFNGTAGIWRKRSIAESGGWQHDTLTEDVDLSYRAQLRGWKFVYLSDLLSPAELPPEIAAFKQQQHRWTKGSVQTAVKLLPAILSARLPWWIKCEAFFHLTCGAVYIPAVLLSLLLFPTFYLQTDLFTSNNIVLAVAISSFFGLLTCSAGTFYMMSQTAIGRSGIKTFFMIPFLMAVGIGISVINGLAVLEGLFNRGEKEFVRTPKYGTAEQWKRRAGSFKKSRSALPYVELTLGLYMLACVVICIVTRKALGTLPFLIIFSFGYLYVAVMTFYSRWVSQRAPRAADLKAAEEAAKAVAA